MRPPNYIDIFAGAGGISLGLYNAGWKGLFAIEKNEMAFSTLQYNLIKQKEHFEWPNWLPQGPHDINQVIEKHYEELLSLKDNVDLVVGGPPCQGFSFAGRRNHSDIRNSLVNSYINFIKIIKPRYLLLENVRGFTVGFTIENKKTKPYSDIVYEKLSNLGYHIEDHLINFSDFGVPQRRIRYILLGSLDNDINEIFENIYQKKSEFLNDKNLINKQRVTVKNALSDLEKRRGIFRSEEFPAFQMGEYGPARSNYQKLMRRFCGLKKPDSHRFSKHNELVENRLKYFLTNCVRNHDVSDEIKKEYSLKKHSITPLDPNKVCPTLTSLPDDLVHYSEPRILTVREYARLQSFPDWYEFKGKYTTGGKLRKEDVPRYTQIGNAVPPLFIEHVGKIIKQLF